MVVLTAYVALKPERVAEALQHCSTVRGHSVKEPGCERYDFYWSPDDATRLVFVEEWTSKADLDRHFEQAAFLEFVAAMEACTQSPTEIRIFEASLLG